MPRHRTTKADLEAVCDDIAATFNHDYKTDAVEAMEQLIMERFGEIDWMERSELAIAFRTSKSGLNCNR
jgi:hypothetical protein